MCDATTALGMQVAGVAQQTVGSFYTASGQKLALETQAKISETNARVAEMTAQSVLLAGQKDEQNVRLRTAALKSKQRATMAANGIDINSDTPLEVLTSTDVMGEVDANTTAANAARTAWGHRFQSVGYQNESLMSRATARGINPFMSAGNTLLTGASSVASNYYMMKKLGA
jgi:hypothetical protein